MQHDYFVLICCIHGTAGAQLQRAETCNALRASIAGGDGSELLGECTVDRDCLMISCSGGTNTTVTIFPCEIPIRVNFIVGPPLSINVSSSDTVSTLVAPFAILDTIIEQSPGGIRFGVSVLAKLILV